MDNLSAIFKAYDVRGIYPNQLDEKTAARVGEAYATVIKPKKIAVGRDVRDSGKSLKKELIGALLASGVDVVDIGTITTDQLYFAVGHYGLDGGISVTASHNPAEYNGFKFSESGGAPIGSEQLKAIRDWAVSDKNITPSRQGKLASLDFIDGYIKHVLSYIDSSSIQPLKVVANANFGAVGRGVDLIASKLKVDLVRLNWAPDGSFPKGPPNPLLPENRRGTTDLIKSAQPDLGVAWDADADRVFFFTGKGEFVPSPYIIALLATEFLKKYPDSKIVHDVTTAWIMDDAIKQAGGLPVINRTGHTFIKARMRAENAPFGGESSGHYYFKDSFYADNGLVPFLLILQAISRTGKSLGELVGPLIDSCRVSNEINFTLDSPAKAIKIIEAKFGSAGRIDKTDGLTIETSSWRFNARPSNTEPLFRLNAEARDQTELDKLIEAISKEISKLNKDT